MKHTVIYKYLEGAGMTVTREMTQVKQNHQNLVTAVQGIIQGILVTVARKTLPNHHKQTQVTAVVTRMERMTRRMMVQEVQNSLQQVQMPPQQTIHPMTAPQQPQTAFCTCT